MHHGEAREDQRPRHQNILRTTSKSTDQARGDDTWETRGNQSSGRMRNKYFSFTLPIQVSCYSNIPPSRPAVNKTYSPTLTSVMRAFFLKKYLRFKFCDISAESISIVIHSGIGFIINKEKSFVAA